MKPPTTTTSVPTPAATDPTQDTTHILRGCILMSASLAFFTAHTLLIKSLSVFHGISVWQTLWFRFFVSAVITALVFGPGGDLKFWRVTHHRYLLARGLLGVIGTAFFYLAIDGLGAGVATLITNTYVVFSILLAAWLLKEPLSLRRLAWIAVALTGLAILTTAGKVSGMTSSGTWVDYLIAVGGALTAGVVIVIIRKLHRTESTATIFWAQCGWGTVLITPILPFVWSTPTGPAFGLLMTCATLACMGQLTMTAAFRHLPVSMGAGFQMALPVLTAFGGVLFLNEQLAIIQWFAAALIIFGTFNAVRRRVHFGAKPLPKA